METLFNDELINKKLLEKMRKDVRKEQLVHAMESIDDFFEYREKTMFTKQKKYAILK